MDIDRCAACGRVFVGRSCPSWAFTRDGRPAGRIHASCRSRHFLTDPAHVQEIGHLRVWSWDIESRAPRDSDRWHAGMLIGHGDDHAVISETLTPGQESLLRWWTVEGSMQLGEHRADGIRAAYAELVREFRAWRAALEPAPNGCALEWVADLPAVVGAERSEMAG